MKHKILSIKIEIVYRLAIFTTRLSTLFCDKHHELYQEWKKEFNNYEGVEND